jgi:hypothetical protein
MFGDVTRGGIHLSTCQVHYVFIGYSRACHINNKTNWFLFNDTRYKISCLLNKITNAMKAFFVFFCQINSSGAVANLVMACQE